MVQTQKIYLMQFLDLGLSYGGLELPSPSCMQPVGSNPRLSDNGANNNNDANANNADNHKWKHCKEVAFNHLFAFQFTICIATEMTFLIVITL